MVFRSYIQNDFPNVPKDLHVIPTADVSWLCSKNEFKLEMAVSVRSREIEVFWGGHEIIILSTSYLP